MPQMSPGGPLMDVSKTMCGEALCETQAGMIDSRYHLRQWPHGVNVKVDSTCLIHKINKLLPLIF